MKVDVSLERIKVHGTLSDEYREYRVLWNEVPKNHLTTHFPLHLDIEVTNRCNLNCEMCAFHSEKARFKPRPEDMRFNLFKKIIDEGAEKGLMAIKLNYSGEPLLYPQIFEAIKYAKDKGIIDVMFNTNGTLLTNKNMTKLITSGLDKLIISDYGDQDVKQNLTVLHCIKELHGKKNPLVRVQRLVYPGEKKEDVIEKLKFEYDEITDELGVQLYFEYNKKKKNKKKSSYECAYPWQRMLILANGDVLSCCGMPHETKKIGNAYMDTIESLWKSKYMSFVREKMENKESHLIKACTECPMRIKIIEDKDE
jgi:radical SAM protein with 4Fe4S-binding SPASM domain